MIGIANAPCSWGVIENIAGDRDQYRQVIDDIQATGYVGTELGDWGFMPTDPARLRAELDERQLRLVGSWVSVFLHDRARHQQSLLNALRTARQLAAVGGPEAIVILGNDPYGDPQRTQHAGRIAPDMAMDDATWDLFAAGAMRIARSVREETGLRTVFHHHIGTWVETEAETLRLMRMTDPTYLGLCFDTGHWQFASGDAVMGLRAFADRIWHVHFKDCDPQIAARSRQEEWSGVTSVAHGVFCELGHGVVPFATICSILDKLGYTGWIVVEQDIVQGMGTPTASAARNRAYLASLGL